MPRLNLSPAPPPKMEVLPPLATSVVARTTLRARRVARTSALSSRGLLGSVNWTSNAIALAPAAARLRITRACRRRRNGQRGRGGGAHAFDFAGPTTAPLGPGLVP